MSWIDRAISTFSPEWAYKRERYRMATNEIRKYNAAQDSRLNMLGRRSGKAADESARAHSKLAGVSQGLVRNNPLALRIKSVIANNMIGKGIEPNYTAIKGSKRSQKRIDQYKLAFDAWALSTNCDYEGHNTLYGLQWLWAAAVVESGGVFVRLVVNNALKFPMQLQTLEQQFLDESKSGQLDNSEIIDGIQYSNEGYIEGYWLKTRLNRSTRFNRDESKYYPASDIAHIFWKDRPGQHLGVSWLHAVANLIAERDELRDSQLTQHRVASCLGLVVKEPPKGMTTVEAQGGGLLDADGQQYTDLEPGMVAYTGANTDVSVVTPPNSSNSTDLRGGIDQDIAAGSGVTREQLTGDYSKVTWASGRLARGEFYSNLDRWQHFMMIPALNRIHDWFDMIYQIMVGSVPEVTRDWVIPHRSAVNPKEELETDIMKVRTAAMSPQEFSMKHGVKFETVVEAWKAAKAIMGDLPFDHDPSKFSSAGNQLDDNDAASANKKTTESDKKTDEAAEEESK